MDSIEYYDFKQLKFIDNFDNVETIIKIDRDFKESSSVDQNKVKKIILNQFLMKIQMKH